MENLGFCADHCEAKKTISGQAGMPVLHGEIMQQLLSKMIGKKVDVYCGGASSLRGEVVSVEDDVLRLKNADGKTCFVAVDKIMVVWEARDEEHRAGFVPSHPGEK